MTRFASLVPVFLLAFGSVGCAGDDGGGGRGARGNGNGSGGPGSGNGSGLNGGLNGGLNPGDLGGSGDGGDCGAVLPMVIRDFQGQQPGVPGGHPDFELSAARTHEGAPFEGWNDMGCEMVEHTLGTDGKPVLYTGEIDKQNPAENVALGSGRQQRIVSGPDCWSPQNTNPNPAGTCYVGTCQPWNMSGPSNGSYGEIQSAATFNQWYNDVPGVNETFELELPLTEAQPGVYVYDTDAFFPIDGLGFGNTPGWNHNYHFTTEIRVLFTYEEGQRFTFRGDDDLWIFVNGRLALDVGGLHQALTGTIDFDLQRNDLGITPGRQYEMAIFHAERQTVASNFRIETTISCFEPAPVVR